MNKDRIKQLQDLLKQTPHDPFLLYALGLEHKETDPKTCIQYFKQLLINHEDYMGTYYHAAEVFTTLGMLEKAKATYEKGIKIAANLNENHALRELQNAFQNFKFAYDL